MEIESMIKKYIEQGTQEAEPTKHTVEEMKNAANEFKQSASNFLQSIARWGGIDSSIQNLSSTNPSQLKNIMKHHFNISQGEVKTCSFNFQSQLDKFLDRKIILTYVSEEGEIYFYSEEEERVIIENSTAKSGSTNVKLRGWDIKNHKSLNDFFLNNEQKFDVLINHQKNILNVYNQAIYTYDETANKHRAGENNTGRSLNNFIYWHAINSRKRIYAFVLNKGILKEAYFAAVFNLDENNIMHFQNINTPKEADPYGLIYFYYNFIKEVDNRAGALSGDIGEFLDPIQFAIKSGNPSSQGLLILIDIAKHVITLPINDITPQKLVSWFLDQEQNKKRGFSTHKLVQKISKKLTKTAIEKVNEELRDLRIPEMTYTPATLEEALEDVLN